MLNDQQDINSFSPYGTNLWDPSCPITSVLQLAVDYSRWKHTLVQAFRTHYVFTVSSSPIQEIIHILCVMAFSLPFTIHTDFAVYSLSCKQYILIMFSFFAFISWSVSSEKIIYELQKKEHLIIFGKNNLGLIICLLIPLFSHRSSFKVISWVHSRSSNILVLYF